MELLPSHGAGARIRTTCTGFGDPLLSQEHPDMVPTAGFEPALSRRSTYCLCRLGYVGLVLGVGFEPTLAAF